eukprot:TRINITY_DN37022_c0_g1_i2.p1 TRINITY_DN37022_c0_g1~~TRINITY_DN37022_c0_g1_i2.p1  ORF type:complete len:150 (+),score=7.17 TRINITY_DN37022_c0_g1_i2:447-896(+)
MTDPCIVAYPYAALAALRLCPSPVRQNYTLARCFAILRRVARRTGAPQPGFVAPSRSPLLKSPWLARSQQLIAFKACRSVSISALMDLFFCRAVSSSSTSCCCKSSAPDGSGSCARLAAAFRPERMFSRALSHVVARRESSSTGGCTDG